MEQLKGWRVVDPASARSVIARLVLERLYPENVRLGSIELLPHQTSAIARLRSTIAEFGGALLCDPVGTGKTYVALGLIPGQARTLIVAPAILRQMWIKAASLASRDATFASVESLSRGMVPEQSFDFVIVDEAHHVRNPATRRYRMLSRIVSNADVILLTATPVHNRAADLRSMLALFLGSRADVLTAAELSRCIVRRSDLVAAVSGIPEVAPLKWLRIREDIHMPALLLALPPPVTTRDGGDGGALIAHSLIRQWSSSDAALHGAVQRRLVRAESLLAALDDGTWPSRSELSCWIAGDDTVQLTFSGLLSDPAPGTRTLAADVRTHARALRVARDRIRQSTSDAERASLIRHIRSAHAGERIVAFSQYMDTVNAMFSRLARDGEVALLTGSGARVAGGMLSRSEAIERFAPIASGRAEPGRSERVTLLLATDLLSEGINLQDASVVIHLDLPWTPARMEQRLGRIARAGSRHERVQAYAFHPPVSSDDIVRIESLLRRKMEAAGIATDEFHSLKGWTSPNPPQSSPSINEAIRRHLSRWVSGSPRSHDGIIVSAVASPCRGFLAVVFEGDRPRLIASLDGTVTDDPNSILRAIQCSESDECSFLPADLEDTAARIRAFVGAGDALGTTRVSSVQSASTRNAAVRRINRFFQNARPHARSMAAIQAALARRVLVGDLNAYQELELESLSRVESDEDWLRSVIAIGAARKPRRGEIEERQIRAILLLG